MKIVLIGGPSAGKRVVVANAILASGHLMVPVMTPRDIDLSSDTRQSWEGPFYHTVYERRPIQTERGNVDIWPNITLDQRESVEELIENYHPNIDRRPSKLESALRECLHVLEKGFEVRLQKQWPTLQLPMERAIARAKSALADLEENDRGAD